MQRVAAVGPVTATGFGKQLLDTVQRSLGITPNLMRTMAQSPVVLNGYLQLYAALAGGTLNGRLRESLTLAVSESNGCERSCGRSPKTESRYESSLNGMMGMACGTTRMAMSIGNSTRTV